MTHQATNLEAWTTEQLFAEALERSGQNVPALRQMERLILRSLLTAHDAGQQRLASSTQAHNRVSPSDKLR